MWQTPQQPPPVIPLLRTFLIAGNVPVPLNDRARPISHKSETLSFYWPASVVEDTEDTKHYRHLSLRV